MATTGDDNAPDDNSAVTTSHNSPARDHRRFSPFSIGDDVTL